MNRALTSWTAELKLFLSALLMIIGGAAQAQSFPELTGRVVDSANILSDIDEAALTTKLEALEQQTGRQLVLATIPDLQGYDIADYGYRLGREWAIGQDGKGEAEKDNGTLLIVAPNDRQVRIEVGYGLEGILTDALSSTIIQTAIIPEFKQGNMPAGISAGIDALVTQLSLPEDEARAYAQQVDQQAQEEGGGWGGIVFWLFILFFIFIFVVPSSGGKRHRGGTGPVVIWGGGSDSGGSSWGSGGGFGGGGFSGGGGSFGGGGSSGSW